MDERHHPIRVLHVIDPGSPGGGSCTLRLLAEPLERIRSISQDVLILGTRAHAALARRCGVDPTGRLAYPAGLPTAGRSALRNMVAHYEAAGQPYDLIHCWSIRAALLAMTALPERKRLASFSVGPVTGFETGVFQQMLERAPMPILAGSNAVRREYLSLGAPEELISVHPPAVNPESVDMADRAELRDRWGVNDHTFVVGLLSEPVSWADARTAMAVISRAASTGRDVRLLVHHSAERRKEAARWARRIVRADLLITDDEVADPWRVVGGLNAALLIGGQLNASSFEDPGNPLAWLTGVGRRMRPMPGILPLLWAMSAGVPVLAESSDAVQGVVREGETGLLVPQFDTNTACARLLRLYDERRVGSRLGHAAQEHVRRNFHVSAYCVRLKEIYHRVVDGRAARIISEDAGPLVERRDQRTMEWKEEIA